MGDLFDMQLGKMLSATTRVGPRQRPYLANRNVQWNRIDLTNVETMNFSALEDRTYGLTNGDLLVCEGGEIGRTAIWTGELEDCHFQNAVHRLRPTDGSIAPRYFLHFMRFAAEHGLFRRLSGQTSIAHLTKEGLRQLAIPVPSVSEQTGIAQTLDTVDNAIRSAEGVIAKLELIKQGLLHDLLTRGIGHNGELRDPVLQSGQFVETPLGLLPRAWEVRTLQELADVSRGKFTHRPRNDPAYYGGVAPFIQTGDVAAANGAVIMQASQSLSERGVAVSSKFPTNTIAVTIAANIADTAILGTPMYFPDSVVGVQVGASHSVRYIELCIRAAQPRLEARAPQSAQKNINLQDLRPLLIPVPSWAEQTAIVAAYEAHAKDVMRATVTKEKLSLLKSGLMDDLLTGRVRVMDNEDAA